MGKSANRPSTMIANSNTQVSPSSSSSSLLVQAVLVNRRRNPSPMTSSSNSTSSTSNRNNDHSDNKSNPQSSCKNHGSSSSRLRLATDTVRQSARQFNMFNLFVLFAFSILTNVIYFNFVYVPGLRGNDLMVRSTISGRLHELLPDKSSSKDGETGLRYFGSLFALSSIIKFSGLSSSSTSPGSTESLPAPSSSSSSFDSSSQSGGARDRDDQNDDDDDDASAFRLISWPHVSFAYVDDDPSKARSSADHMDNYAATFIAGLLDDSKSTTKKNLETRRKESKMALKLASSMQKAGKINKAFKILKFALSMDPDNPELLAVYGEHLEHYKNDIVEAEHFYRRAVSFEPEHVDANLNLRRATPIVSKIDRDMLNSIDDLLKTFYEIPSTSSTLRRVKKEAYFMHIYHSNAIEGNTLDLDQTRHILESRMAVGGKSLQEHNEVLGLDAAIRYINQTLLYKPLNEYTIEDVKELHRRVLGYCDPIESGHFRKHQVYVGKFTPPEPEKVEEEMIKFVEWLNSNQLQQAHPIQIATLVHYKFVYIHPFYDGNGRTGRLLMNLMLMKFGYPPIIIQKDQRLEYYDVLIKGNQGDLKPFVRFIARCAQRTLHDFINQCNGTSNSLGADDPMKLIRSDLQVVEDYFVDTIPSVDATSKPKSSAAAEELDDDEHK